MPNWRAMMKNQVSGTIRRYVTAEGCYDVEFKGLIPQRVKRIPSEQTSRYWARTGNWMIGNVWHEIHPLSMRLPSKTHPTMKFNLRNHNMNPTVITGTVTHITVPDGIYQEI